MQVADLVNTHNDRLARLLRKKLRLDGVTGEVTVVFSPERAAPGSMREVPLASASSFKRSYYGTMSYMPATFGLHAAAYVIGELSGVNRIPVSRKRKHISGVPPGTKPNPPRRPAVSGSGHAALQLDVADARAHDCTAASVNAMPRHVAAVDRECAESAGAMATSPDASARLCSPQDTFCCPVDVRDTTASTSVSHDAVGKELQARVRTCDAQSGHDSSDACASHDRCLDQDARSQTGRRTCAEDACQEEYSAQVHACLPDGHMYHL